MAGRRTGARRSAAKEATWRKLLAEWRSSGKTLGEFAAERGVKYWTARGWATELKKRDAERAKEPVVPEGPQETIVAPGPVFAPVRVVASRPRELVRRDRLTAEPSSLAGQVRGERIDATVLAAGTFELFPYGPVRIRVPPGFDPRALRALLDVLEAPC